MHRTDCSNLSSEMTEKRGSPDHEEEQVATIRSSTPDTQNINGDSVVSFIAETQVNSGRDVTNISKSPSYCDNKSAYSPMVGCPSSFLVFLFTCLFSAEEIGVVVC